MKDELIKMLQKQDLLDNKTYEQQADEILNLFNVSVSLPLVEVDPEILQICIEAYNNGEKITAVKTLIEEANRTTYRFGIKQASEFLKSYERNDMHELNRRFEQIILMCQDARKKYGFDYEEKYKSKIYKFSEEIIGNNLIDKCKSKHFAKQLCIMNNLTYE